VNSPSLPLDGSLPHLENLNIVDDASGSADCHCDVNLGLYISRAYSHRDEEMVDGFVLPEHLSRKLACQIMVNMCDIITISDIIAATSSVLTNHAVGYIGIGSHVKNIVRSMCTHLNMCGINSTPVHAVYDKRSSDKGKKQQSGELLIGIDNPTAVLPGDLEIALHSYSLLHFYDMHTLMVSRFKLLSKNKKGATILQPMYRVDSLLCNFYTHINSNQVIVFGAPLDRAGLGVTVELYVRLFSGCTQLSLSGFTDALNTIALEILVLILDKADLVIRNVHNALTDVIGRANATVGNLLTKGGRKLTMQSHEFMTRDSLGNNQRVGLPLHSIRNLFNEDAEVEMWNIIIRALQNCEDRLKGLVDSGSECSIVMSPIISIRRTFPASGGLPDKMNVYAMPFKSIQIIDVYNKTLQSQSVKRHGVVTVASSVYNFNPQNLLQQDGHCNGND